MWDLVHLFSQHIGDLLYVASIGDIILVYRVGMKTYEGDVYAVFNKRFSSFALYEGKDGENFHPYQVSFRFHARVQDDNIIAGLRKWVANFKVIDGWKMKCLTSCRYIWNPCLAQEMCYVHFLLLELS